MANDIHLLLPWLPLHMNQKWRKSEKYFMVCLFDVEMYCLEIIVEENKRPPGLIAPPFTIGFLTTENLLKVKLGQVEVVSKSLI